MSLIKKYGIYFFLFFLPMIIYAPTLSGTFYYDDNAIFLGHQVKNLAENPFSVFNPESHYLPGAPRSLHVFILLVIYKFFGSSPLPYHAVNLIFHGITTLLIFIFAKKITPEFESSYGIAVISALTFGLHPIHTENITFVTLGGTDLLMTLFSVLSLILYMEFRSRQVASRYFLLFLSILAYFFSVLSKETAMAFIFVFPLTEFLIKKKGFAWTLPYLFLLVVLKWGFISGSVPVILGKTVNKGAGTLEFLKIFDALGYSLRALILPYPQSVLIKEFDSRMLNLSFVAVSASALFLSVYLMRPKELLIYSSLLFATASAPYLFVPFVESNMAIFAERYLYAPSLGFCIFLSTVIVSLFKNKKKQMVITLILCLAYGALGVNYFYSSWRTEEAFWNNAVKMNPDYATGYANLASVEANAGRNDRANELYFKALGKPKGKPFEFALAAFNLGISAQKAGNYSKAESYYMLSLQYDNFQLSHVSLGYLHLAIGNLEKARESFENALRFNTSSSRALYGLAKYYSLLNDKEQAKIYAIKAYNTTSDPALRNLAAELLK